MSDNVTYLQCVNTVKAEPLPIAIADNGKSQRSLNKPSSRLVYAFCTDEEQINTVLEKEARFDLTDPTKKIFGGHAKANFKQIVRTNRYNATILIMAEKVVKSESILFPADLIPLKFNIKPSDNRFVRRYGDAYISLIERGAWFLAYYNFHSETYEEQTDVINHFGANAPLGKWMNIDVGFEEKLRTTISRSSVQMHADVYMAGTGDLLTYPEMKNALEFARKFPSQPIEKLAEENLAILRYFVTGYEKIMDGFEHTAKNRDRMLNLQQRRATLESIENQIHNIKVIRETYRPYARPALVQDVALDTTEQNIRSDIRDINRALAAYNEDPGGNIAPLRLSSLKDSNPVPYLAFEIDVSPILGWGTQSRSANYFLSSVRAGRRIKKIYWKNHIGDGYARFGEWLIEYLETNLITGGDKIVTEVFGTRPTDLLQPPGIDFAAGETITKISGVTTWSGPSIRGFDLTTSTGRRVVPFMSAGQMTPFAWEVKPNHFVFDIFIAAGSDIDAVQPASLNLLPASWGPLEPRHMQVASSFVPHVA